MRNSQFRAVGFGLSVHLARFAVIWITLAVAPFFGISGWYLGPAANVTCVIFAATLVTVRGLWKTSGILVAWRGPIAIFLLLPPMIEALSWAIPAGLIEQAPGYGPWTITLLLATANEELTSRVVVLERMRPAVPQRRSPQRSSGFNISPPSPRRAAASTTSSSMCSYPPATDSRWHRSSSAFTGSGRLSSSMLARTS